MTKTISYRDSAVTESKVVLCQDVQLELRHGNAKTDSRPPQVGGPAPGRVNLLVDVSFSGLFERN